MTFSNVQLLQLITLFHSFANGILLPIIPRHLVKHGADAITIGFLNSTVYVCQKLTTDIFALVPRGKRHVLKFSLTCCLLCYFVLLFDHYLWTIFLIRCLIALTTNITDISKSLVLKTEPINIHIKILNRIDMLKAGGLAVGCILGGYIFVCNKQFSTNVTVSTCSVLACIFLLLFVDSDAPHPENPSRLTQIPFNFYHHLKTLTYTDFKDKWNNFLLKSVYVCAYTIYYSRYVYIMIFNYDVGCVRLGYTLAFESIVAFFSLCFVPFIKEKIVNKKILLISTMLISAFLLIGLFYSPTYRCHLIFFGLTIFINTLVNSLLEDDVLELKSENDIDECSHTLTDIINVVAPIFTGVIVEVFGGGALKLIAVMPVAAYWYIINQDFVFLIVSQGEYEED